MKTLLSAIIDGHEVVTHIGEAAVDPMATGIKIKAMLSDLPEWAGITLLEGEIDARRQQAVDAFSAMFGHSPQTLATQAEANYWGMLVDAANADVAAIHSKTVPLRADLETKRAELWGTHAVYSQPGPSPVGSEVLIVDDQAAGYLAKLDALTPEQKLALTGEVLADLRGVKFWTPDLKTSAVVSRLGDTLPTGAIRETALTDAQRATIAAQQEAARVAAMTPDARAAELALVLDALGNQAVAMDTKAAMMGEPLTGKAWFDAQKNTALAKYA